MAVESELKRRGLDVSLLDMPLDAPLPPSLVTSPVMLEFTELYLDERSFMEHSASKDYMSGYSEIMIPQNQLHVPKTYRFGTPPTGIIEKILDPILKEVVVEHSGCVWKESDIATPVWLSLDINGMDVSPPIDDCTTMLCFNHPLRENCTRIMCVIDASQIKRLSTLRCLRGEAFCKTDHIQTVKQALIDADLSMIKVNDTRCVGYVLHDKASQLVMDDVLNNITH